MKTKLSVLTNKSALLLVIGICLSILLLAIAWWVAIRPTPSVVTQEQNNTFFESEVRPALNTYDIRNEAAVDSAVYRISRGIDDYRNGIKPFVEDITAWGTRFGVIRWQASDLGEKWWGNPANATAVNRYVTAKFDRHLFSEQKLNALVASSLEQFRDDLAANQNRLYADVKAAWERGGHTSQDLNLQKIIQQVNANMVATSTKMATDSVTVGIISFLGGFALEETTTALVKVIAAHTAIYMATSAAATSASSGGATGAGATGGAAAGSTIGPWGTVIGIAAGIAVGIIADWWMTGELEEKLTTECEEMISGVKSQIIDGTTQAPGLRHAFIESIRALRGAEEQEIQTVLEEMAS